MYHVYLHIFNMCFSFRFWVPKWLEFYVSQFFDISSSWFSQLISVIQIPLLIETICHSIYRYFIYLFLTYIICSHSTQVGRGSVFVFILDLGVFYFLYPSFPHRLFDFFGLHCASFLKEDFSRVGFIGVWGIRLFFLL